MPELTIALLSKGTSQNFTKAEVLLGRDPSCDLVFQSSEFPMVGRQHAVLRENGGGWSVEDLQSTNGTFVNQVRVQRQDLVPGDTVRLGSDGPEVRVQFLNEASVQPTRPAALAAAVGVAVTQPSAMPSAELPPTRPAVPPTAPVVGPTKPSPARYSAPATTIRTAQEQEKVAQPEVSSPVAAPAQQAEISEKEEGDPMNEEKLSLLRNLVFVMVALVLVLGGIVISQTQDIRRDLKNMHDEATQVVVGRMDKKIQEVQDSFSQTMDKKIQQANTDLSTTMDQKMAEAQKKFDADIHKSMSQEEDHLMNRVKQELPGILDQEIERQKRKIMQ